MTKVTRGDVSKMVQLYTTPTLDGAWLGCQEIAKQFDVTYRTVQYWLKKQGIQLRSQKEAHAHGKRCRPARHGKTLPPCNETPPFCKCGCKEPVAWNSRKYRWNLYVKGHYHPQPYKYAKHERKRHTQVDLVWLESQYIDLSRPSTDIAKELDVTPSTVRRWLRQAGIPIRSQAESLRLSGAIARENNPSWNGGVADWSYSPNWKTICKLIKDRDEWTCQLCNKQRIHWGPDLHCHHIDGNKLNSHPWNLISLCSSCHHPIHSDEAIRDRLSAIARERTADVSQYLW